MKLWLQYNIENMAVQYMSHVGIYKSYGIQCMCMYVCIIILVDLKGSVAVVAKSSMSSSL